MSSRAGLRFFQTSSRTLRTTPFRQHFQRRITTAAEPNVAPPPNQSYMTRLWQSPVGPKTVHFWAPIMKWGLVLAGVSDFARPAESLSLPQNAALMATGMIWTRWCFVIRPKNMFLAAVNFFLFCVGATQVSRIFLYHRGLKDSTITEEITKAARDAEQTIKDVVEHPERAVEKAKESARA